MVLVISKAFASKSILIKILNIYSGSRLIRIALHDDVDELPRHITISGYYCRLWHRGQTIPCHICSEGGHKAASYTYKGKCL